MVLPIVQVETKIIPLYIIYYDIYTDCKMNNLQIYHNDGIPRDIENWFA